LETRVCVLASGSSGNAIYIGNDKTNILIDAGLSGRRIEEALKEIGVRCGDIDCILITHEHRDHILGAGVLSRRYDIPIYANEKTWEGIGKSIGEVREKNKRVFENKFFCVKSFTIKPFPIPHDALDPVAFSIYTDGKKITTATDIGHFNTTLEQNLKDSNLLILESNHDPEMLKFGPYPLHLKRRIMGKKGHLSNTEAALAAVRVIKSGPVQLLLGHLSAQNNIPELAVETVAWGVQSHGLQVGKDVKIDLTYRDKRSSVYVL